LFTGCGRWLKVYSMGGDRSTAKVLRVASMVFLLDFTAKLAAAKSRSERRMSSSPHPTSNAEV
jgi:hypothetical protein